MVPVACNCHNAAVRCDPRELHRLSCDLLVVGAGIQGAALARDAARRGLSTVLVDARDLAAGTSSRSSRLVHGGLRYLQHGHFALVREALQERERLLRLAPHLVRPLPMLMPFFRDGGVGRLRLRLGLWLYATLARGSTLPRPRGMSAAAALAAFPGLRARGLRSAVEFFDAATDDVRLVLANVLDAVAAGARFASYCRLVGSTADGVVLRDLVGGEEVLLRPQQVVSAAGPAVDSVRAACGLWQASAPEAALVRHSRGSHVVLPPRPGELALAAFLPDQRIQFVLPHRDGTLCGTTDVEDALEGDETGPPVADLDYLEQALGFLLDPAPQRHDFLHAYAGWRALPNRKGPPGALHREAFLVTEAAPHGPLHSLVGGKLTTHRALAERTIAALFGRQGPSPTRTLPLPGGAGPREVADPLWWRHGARRELLWAIEAAEPDAAAALCPHRPFRRSEAIAAIRHDGVVYLADLLLRRLAHSQGPCLETACLAASHRLLLRERRWPVDGDAERAIALLRAEVAVLRGKLPVWQAQSAVEPQAPPG